MTVGGVGEVLRRVDGDVAGAARRRRARDADRVLARHDDGVVAAHRHERVALDGRDAAPETSTRRSPSTRSERLPPPSVLWAPPRACGTTRPPGPAGRPSPPGCGRCRRRRSAGASPPAPCGSRRRRWSSAPPTCTVRSAPTREGLRAGDGLALLAADGEGLVVADGAGVIVEHVVEVALGAEGATCSRPARSSGEARCTRRPAVGACGCRGGCFPAGARRRDVGAVVRRAHHHRPVEIVPADEENQHLHPHRGMNWNPSSTPPSSASGGSSRSCAVVAPVEVPVELHLDAPVGSVWDLLARGADDHRGLPSPV